MPPRAAKPSAGSGFAVATAINRSRSTADVSMSEGDGSDLNAMQQMYEFKENDEQQQAIDDIDDFERRLCANCKGDFAPTAKPLAAVRAAAAPTSGVARSGAASKPPKKAGAEYVQQARAQAAGGLKLKAARSDEVFADEADDARQAMSELNRFDKALGADDDDD